MEIQGKMQQESGTAPDNKNSEVNVNEDTRVSGVSPEAHERAAEDAALERSWALHQERADTQRALHANLPGARFTDTFIESRRTDKEISSSGVKSSELWRFRSDELDKGYF